MDLRLTTLEQSLKLKKIGFNVKLPKYFKWTEQHNQFLPRISYSYIDYNCYSPRPELYVTRPTVALALMWLREEKKIFASIYPSANMQRWHIRIHKFEEYENIVSSYPLHDDAQDAALNIILDLINIS